MSDSAFVREIIQRLAEQSGITKKMAARILHTIPGIIEEGLKKDGEARVKGLGTFKLKQVKTRIGRNPKTGERVEIPPHTRVVFLPEQSFKDYINRDYRLLSYKIIPSAGQAPPVDETIPGPGPETVPETFPPYIPEPEPASPYQFQPPPEPEPEPTPEPPARKRKLHWIVPVAVSVIILLSLIFYFRNFYHREDSSQQSAVSSQQSIVSSQRLEDSVSVKPVPEAQPAGTAADSSQRVVEPTQDSEPRTPARTTDVVQSGGQNSELRTIAEGQHLFRIAREIYGNPYLWVLIYRANKNKITDPDLLISGKELSIPALEGTPDHLTGNDSLAVADGYRMIYEYLSSVGDPHANDFLKAMERYKPE